MGSDSHGVSADTSNGAGQSVTSSSVAASSGEAADNSLQSANHRGHSDVSNSIVNSSRVSELGKTNELLANSADQPGVSTSRVDIPLTAPTAKSVEDKPATVPARTHHAAANPPEG